MSARPSGRAYAGFFSSARTLELPVNPRLDPAALHGYPIDFSVKAASPDEPPPWQLPASAIQWGLGCYERWLTGQGDAWLDAARHVAWQLVERQQRGGRLDGGWLHDDPLTHTYHLGAPWLSALPQGEGVSLLVRIHKHTSDERLLEAAVNALRPLQRQVADGGVSAPLDGQPFPEEYPTDPPSYVLNGAIFALWGFHDLATAVNDATLHTEFERRVDSLAYSVHKWDTGHWSRYDLFPHPVPNIASSFYHALHINQLRAMNILAPRAELQSTVERFERYAASRTRRLEAFARKVSFRLAVPRSPVLTRLRKAI